MKNDKLKLNISNQFTLSGNEEQNINITLEDATTLVTGSVTGTIFDTSLTGKPIPNATVKVFTIDGTPYAHTLSDENGHYSINNLPLGLYTIAAVIDDKYLSLEQALTVTNIIPVNIDLIVKPLIKKNNLYGKILDKNTNKPIDNVNVILSQIVDNNNVLIKNTLSINDGEYILNDIDNGKYNITFTKNGYQTFKINDVNLSDNGNIETNVILVPEASQSTGTISGQILNNKKIPIYNAFVALYNIIDDKETIVATTYTNENGKYRFGNVASGNYLVKSKF